MKNQYLDNYYLYIEIKIKNRYTNMNKYILKLIKFGKIKKNMKNQE